MANSVDKEYHDVLVGRFNTLKEHYDEIYSKINHEKFKTFDELTLTVKKESLEKQIDLLAAKYVLLMDEFNKQTINRR